MILFLIFVLLGVGVLFALVAEALSLIGGAILILAGVCGVLFLICFVDEKLNANPGLRDKIVNRTILIGNTILSIILITSLICFIIMAVYFTITHWDTMIEDLGILFEDIRNSFNN